jgi:hypothetical protein
MSAYTVHRVQFEDVVDVGVVIRQVDVAIGIQRQIRARDVVA